MEQLNPGQVKKNIKQLKQRQEQYLFYLGQLAFQAGELGKLQDPGMIEAYHTLKGIQAQIAQGEASLQQMKAAREAAQKPRCPHCGEPLQKGAVFCARCGSNLSAATPVGVAAAAAAGRVCSNCGSPLDDDAIFCGNCGARSAGAAAPQAEAAAEEPSPSLEETHACPKCGADTPKGMVLCGACAAAEEPSPSLEETHACPKCGAGIPDKDMIFCSVCGTKVR